MLATLHSKRGGGGIRSAPARAVMLMVGGAAAACTLSDPSIALAPAHGLAAGTGALDPALGDTAFGVQDEAHASAAVTHEAVQHVAR